MDFRYPLSACLFLSAFCSASAVRAASPWTDTHAPSAATITAMGKTGRGTLLAGTSYGFLFRSTDGGATWARTWTDGAGVPPRIFLASGDSLILAAYGTLPDPLADCSSGCGPYDPMAGTVLASLDDGISWTATGSGGVLALGQGPQGSPIAAGKGILLYSREAMSWNTLAFGFSAAPRATLYPFWTAIAWSGSRIVGIYDSSLYSAEYLPGQDSVTFSNVLGAPVASLFQTGSYTFLSTGQGLFRFEGFRGSDAANRIFLDTSGVSGLMEADSGYLIGKSGNRLRRGNVQGGAWETWGPGLPDGAQAMVWLGKDVIAGGTRFPQPLRSVSGGPWTGFGNGIAEFPTDPLLATREAVFASTYQGVMSKHPGGAWSRVDSLGPEKNVSFMAQGNETVWAGGKSLWRATGDPAHAQWTLPRGIDPGAVPVRFGTTGKHILASYHANVGGESYNFLAVCPVDGDSCRVTSPGMLGRPRSYSYGTGNLVYGIAGLGDTIVAADSLLHRSWDGGRTWDTLPSGSLIPRAQYAFLGKRLVSFGEASRNNCGVGHCWQYSDDVGETWRPIYYGGPENAPVFDYQVSGGVLFSANDSGVFASSDGFEWKEYQRPGGRLRRLAAGDGILAVGTDDSRLQIMELEAAGLKRTRKRAIPAGAGNGNLRNGILVKDARGKLRRMDGKAAADPRAAK